MSAGSQQEDDYAGEQPDDGLGSVYRTTRNGESEQQIDRAAIDFGRKTRAKDNVVGPDDRQHDWMHPQDRLHQTGSNLARYFRPHQRRDQGFYEWELREHLAHTLLDFWQHEREQAHRRAQGDGEEQRRQPHFADRFIQ